jgi:hypothetical protein
VGYENLDFLFIDNYNSRRIKKNKTHKWILTHLRNCRIEQKEIIAQVSEKLGKKFLTIQPKYKTSLQ